MTCTPCLAISLIILFYFLYKLLRVFAFPKKRDRSKHAYKNKVILITGASSGIGKSLAHHYAKMGATLVLAARNKQALEEITNDCKQLGATMSHVCVTDVTKEEDCKHLIEETIKMFKKLDILILNAGVTSIQFFEDQKDLSVLKKIMDVNYWGCIYPTFYALKYLKQSNGKIGVVSSVLGVFPAPSRTAYAPTKHALHGFFNSLRLELQGKVQITIACPGFVNTNIHHRAYGAEEGVNRNLSGFQSSDDCAWQIIECIEDGKTVEILPFKFKFGLILQNFLPSLVDYLASGTIKQVSTPKTFK